jgi:uncharacterized protein (UPF0548 family)
VTTYPKLTYKKDGTPRVPRGWRKLRHNERLKHGDLFATPADAGFYRGWTETRWAGLKVDSAGWLVYVRRKPARVINRTAPKKHR